MGLEYILNEDERLRLPSVSLCVVRSEAQRILQCKGTGLNNTSENETHADSWTSVEQKGNDSS